MIRECLNCTPLSKYLIRLQIVFNLHVLCIIRHRGAICSPQIYLQFGDFAHARQGKRHSGVYEAPTLASLGISSRVRKWKFSSVNTDAFTNIRT